LGASEKISGMVSPKNYPNAFELPTGKPTKNYGNSAFFMGKFTTNVDFP
jgi:hypothetical protein